MYSAFIRVVIALTAFAPILAILWLINILDGWHSLSVYVSIDSLSEIFQGLSTLITMHWQLLAFVLIVILTNKLMRIATSKLPSYPITLKSIKPADLNFTTVLISYILPWGKLLFKGQSDIYYIIVFLLICFLYAFISKGSYHFNLNIRLFLGYRHYEIQTKDEVTFLMLSKNKLINKNSVKQYVLLTDHMIINAS